MARVANHKPIQVITPQGKRIELPWWFFLPASAGSELLAVKVTRRRVKFKPEPVVLEVRPK